MVLEAERVVDAVREGLGGTSSSQGCCRGVGPAAELPNPEPLEPPGITLLLETLNPEQL